MLLEGEKVLLSYTFLNILKYFLVVKERKKGLKGKNSSKKAFRLFSKTYFLTFKSVSNSGEKLTKKTLSNYLLKNNQNDLKIRPEKYLICEQKYDSGEPHFHVILVYPRRKAVTSPDYYDFLGIHPNIQTMRNMKAALDYVYKEDSNPLTNMNILNQRRIARAKDTSSLYQLLQEQMLKDPFNFDVYQYCAAHNIDKHMYKAHYSKAVSLISKMREVYCNKSLFQKPGFKFISRAHIQSILSPTELNIYDSWPGYQTIVDHLNQIHQYRFRRPSKTMNLLITGPKSTGKSALIWQQYLESSNFNPLNSYCSVYPMGMKDWFPHYKSQIYDVIYWNQAKLTSYSYDVILQLLDGSPVMLPAKGGGHKKVDNPLVIMTSNMTLDQMIKQKFRYNRPYQLMSKQNLSVRITNVVIPPGYNLFLLQKLLVSKAGLCRIFPI